MEASPSAMLKLLVPKIPFMLKTSLLHALSLSETSSKWDLRTELTIKILRQMIGPDSPPTSITKQQRLTTKDPGVKGKVWVSKVSLPLPAEDNVRQLVFTCIEEMGNGIEQWTKPESKGIEGEWNGYRANTAAGAPEEPHLTGKEKEKYGKMMEEVKSKVTVLYFHGGAMYLLDPATYRLPCSRIAKETGGRVFSVRYRLSPQNPFPAALLDAFTAYLSLLYPPETSPHSPVPASEIVFGGDSAGGLLCASLLQLLLQIHRRNPDKSGLPTVLFNGKEAAIPLPAGLALTSPWLDVARSLPSLERLAKYDYLPPPSHTANMTYPKCEAWPTNPPRTDLYCEGSALLHPLVSPLAAKDWTSSPPVFLSLGEEMLRDEDAVVAKRMAKQGVQVVYREFEAMPHCFGMMLEHHPGANVHYGEYGRFCKRAVEESESVKTSAQILKAKSLERKDIEVEQLIQLTDEEVDDFMKKGKERLLKKAEGSGSVEARPML